MTKIFEGKIFAEGKKSNLQKKVEALNKKGITPKLVSILIGDNPASILYTNLKKEAAEKIGALMEVKILHPGVTTDEVVAGIEKLNTDKKVQGIMVQMPIPKKLDKEKIINSINPKKDVDGLRENSEFVPATVKAILQIIEVAKMDVKHDFENVVVVGSTGMVGKPLVKILKEFDYKVTECDIDTKNLSEKTKKADLLISATGKTDLIKESMIKDGIVIIDVGAPKGDVVKEVYQKASFVTPVPGGVGPVTIVSLLDNLLIASQG